MSNPAVSLSHSTTTEPLKSAALAGRSTTIRVVYGAVVAGATRHFPLEPSVDTGACDDAVPDRKYSDCVYPTSDKGKLVPCSTIAPFPPVTGPVTAGFAAEGLAIAAVAGTTQASATAQATAPVTRPRPVTIDRLRLIPIPATFPAGPGKRAPGPCASTELMATSFSGRRPRVVFCSVSLPDGAPGQREGNYS